MFLCRAGFSWGCFFVVKKNPHGFGTVRWATWTGPDAETQNLAGPRLILMDFAILGDFPPKYAKTHENILNPVRHWILLIISTGGKTKTPHVFLRFPTLNQVNGRSDHDLKHEVTALNCILLRDSYEWQQYIPNMFKASFPERWKKPLHSIW